MDKVLYTTTTEEDFTDPYGVKVSDRYGFEELMFIDALANENLRQHGSRRHGACSQARLCTWLTAAAILARCTVPEKI